MKTRLEDASACIGLLLDSNAPERSPGFTPCPAGRTERKATLKGEHYLWDIPGATG